MSEWTADRIPDQAGRLAVVTGANSGLGLVTAREPARKGTRVVPACRSTAKDDSRVVTLSSGAHRFGRIAWATEPGVEGGTFVGPDGFAERRGHTKPVKPNSAARDEQVARRLWEVSEGMTGVRFEPAGAVL